MEEKSLNTISSHKFQIISQWFTNSHKILAPCEICFCWLWHAANKTCSLDKTILVIKTCFIKSCHLFEALLAGLINHTRLRLQQRWLPVVMVMTRHNEAYWLIHSLIKLVWWYQGLRTMILSYMLNMGCSPYGSYHVINFSSKSYQQIVLSGNPHKTSI